ncbi:tetratricopeptide repeat protein 19, mitochondrial [Pristis pectinata]|uniref:tetratricopeptide repeat protein 19, mitochondrial n=1 Tax=Pristis pectinata TaxID=685728 RepID=UPI00223E7FA9|nr:tetratricopeptide repeat protein 19, mitochondrial [Pristis pectinata]
MLRTAGSRGLSSGRRLWLRVPGRCCRPAPPPPPRPASGFQGALTRPTVQSRSGGPGPRSAASLALLAAFGIFQWGEKQPVSDDEIILLIKRSKLSAAKGDLEDAERFLHQALHLAQQSQNNQAISYIYCQMANLAFLRGDLLGAEKLFKATMSQLLGSGTRQDDNALIEMSLKLCSIYATTDRHHLAVEGYKWCIETLEEKVQREEVVPEEVLSVEEKENTRLLLGVTLDSCARYMLSRTQLELAASLYEKALAIAEEVHGETHPQAVVLMNDLATVLDMKGCHDQAYEYVRRASSLARRTGHADEYLILSNLAGILAHRGNYTEAKQVYEEALKQAKSKGDEQVVQRIQEGMEELDASTPSSHGQGEASHK